MSRLQSIQKGGRRYNMPFDAIEEKRTIRSTLSSKIDESGADSRVKEDFRATVVTTKGTCERVCARIDRESTGKPNDIDQ